MPVLFRNCSHILTRTQGEKFGDIFLVKIVSKGTSLTLNIMRRHGKNTVRKDL